MLEIKKLTHITSPQAPENIDIVVANGEAIAVLGANGAGKTTLMRSIAGLEPPKATGEIRLECSGSTPSSSTRPGPYRCGLYRKDGKYSRN